MAVDVKSQVVHWDNPERASEIISRCNYITGVLLNEFHIKDADIVIYPDIKHLHWAEFDKINMIIEEGYKAAEKKVSDIKIKIKTGKIVDKIKGLFGLNRQSF